MLETPLKHRLVPPTTIVVFVMRVGAMGTLVMFVFVSVTRSTSYTGYLHHHPTPACPSSETMGVLVMLRVVGMVTSACVVFHVLQGGRVDPAPYPHWAYSDR